MFRIRKNSFLCMLLITALVIMMLAPAAMARSGQERGTFIVGFHNAPGQSEMRLLRSYGAEVTREFSIIPAVVVELPVRAVNGLQNNPLVFCQL